jgi:hypothetical protein
MLTKLEGAALDWRRSAHEGLPLHPLYLFKEAHARGSVGIGAIFGWLARTPDQLSKAYCVLWPVVPATGGPSIQRSYQQGVLGRGLCV